MLRRTKKRTGSFANETETVLSKQSKTDRNLSRLKERKSKKGLENVIFGGLVIPEENVESRKFNETKEILPAWSDDDDELFNKGKEFLSINISSRANHFEKALGQTPNWAQIKPPSVDKEDETLPSKYLSDATILLPKDSIDIVQCVNLNKQQPSRVGLETCEFHSTSQIAMTASQDCSLHLFQVDGKTNAKIHGLFMEKFPIKCAHFLSNGTDILMTSSRVRWMYNYDMISGKITKIPFIKGLKTSCLNLHKFKVSPNKKHLVFLSMSGKMYVLDSNTKELISTLKMNGSVDDIAFMNDGRDMLSFGDEGIVHVWDMNSRQCVHTFVDEGCVKGTSIAVSPNNNEIACGSYSGIVNMYDNSCLSHKQPNVTKSLKNLQTPVTSLEFNSTSEILAMASNAITNAIRLAHVPSMTVFSNFPEFAPKGIRLVRQLGFSPNSGYFHIGNSAGNALLYRLNHYKNY